MKPRKLSLGAFVALSLGVATTMAAEPRTDSLETNESYLAQSQTQSNSEKRGGKFLDKTTVLVFGNLSPEMEESISIETLKRYTTTMRPGLQQVAMPRFMITDRKGKAIFAIGGYVQARTAYDFAGKVNNLDFDTYSIPMMETPQNRQGLLMDVSTSRLYFKTLVNTESIGNIETYIETDFRGMGANGNYTLRLREAYVKLMGFTVGQTVTTFCDLEASPNTIDFEGPNAYSYGRNIMIRYQRSLGKGFSMAAALEMPVLSATFNNRFAEWVPQRIPDIPVYFQYNWNKNSHVRASGILRTLNYYNLVEQANQHKFGWGVQLSATANVGKKVQLYGNALYGQGIGQYIQDLQGNGFDMAPNLDNLGDMTLTPTFAWLIGAQVNVLPQLPISVGYSQVHVYDRDRMLTMSPNTYKLSQYVVANAFYNFNQSLSVGVEYLYGTRYDLGGSFGKASRVQAMVQFNF